MGIATVSFYITAHIYSNLIPPWIYNLSLEKKTAGVRIIETSSIDLKETAQRSWGLKYYGDRAFKANLEFTKSVC